jgi:hypothetical protein
MRTKKPRTRIESRCESDLRPEDDDDNTGGVDDDNDDDDDDDDVIVEGDDDNGAVDNAEAKAIGKNHR